MSIDNYEYGDTDPNRDSANGKCTACGGSGWQPKPFTGRDCPTCNGSGQAPQSTRKRHNHSGTKTLGALRPRQKLRRRRTMSKLRVTLKDPDTLYDAVNDLLDDELKDVPEDEAKAIREVRGEKYREIAGRWFEYGEYLTVVIDLEAKTIEVEVPES